MRLSLVGLRLSMFIIVMAISAASHGQTQPAQITLDPGTRFQTIDGFGVNFNGTYLPRFPEAYDPEPCKRPRSNHIPA